MSPDAAALGYTSFMATGFDWQTEEEPGDNTDEPVVPVPHSRLRRFLSAFLLFSLVTLLTLLLLFRQLQAQVVIPVTNQTEADVLAAHALLLEAAKSQDVDLFQVQLSAQNETTGWIHTRTLMMEQGNWPGWSTFGLQWGGAAAEPVITLSPDLTQATVRQKQLFHYAPGAEETQEIVLEQTYYYRFSPTGWKLTSAPADKQQAWQTHTFPLAAFIYPATETEFSLRLAKEVRDKVNQFCALVTCDQLPLFTVYLEANPTELAPTFLSEHWSGWTVRPDLYLPSPAMLGTPLDEKGEAVIRLLYTQVIISYLSSRLSQWPGPGHLVTPAQATTVWQIQSALVTLEMRQPHAAAPPRSLDWQPTNWPDNPLVLVCPSEQTSVYQFDALNGTWQTLFKRPTLQEIYPAEAGLILIDEPSPGVEQASWWHDQAMQQLGPSGSETAEIYTSAYAWTTPLTNTLLLF